MNIQNVIYIAMFLNNPVLFGDIPDPVEDFRKTFAALEAGATIIKWERDINNDNLKEMFVCDKMSYDEAINNNVAPEWLLYIKTPSGFIRCDVAIEGDEKTSGVLLSIDLSMMFIGVVSENKDAHGIVCEEIRNPRVGDPIAVIHAYFIENNELHCKKLAEFNPGQSNPIFDKYLMDGKRTVISVAEVKP